MQASAKAPHRALQDLFRPAAPAGACENQAPSTEQASSAAHYACSCMPDVTMGSCSALSPNWAGSPAMGGSPAIGICDTTSIKQRRLHAGLRRASCSKASSTAILTDKGRGERGYLLGRRVSGRGRLLHLILRHRLKGRELVCWRGLLLASQPQRHINIPPCQRWRWIATLEQASALSLAHRCPARPTPRKAVSGVRGGRILHACWRQENLEHDRLGTIPLQHFDWLASVACSTHVRRLLEERLSRAQRLQAATICHGFSTVGGNFARTLAFLSFASASALSFDLLPAGCAAWSARTCLYERRMWTFRGFLCSAFSFSCLCFIATWRRIIFMR